MATQYRKVTAIVRVEQLEHIEKTLQDLRVAGISVSWVKGYGEYTDFFARDHMSSYARIEIFTSAQHADRITEVILGAASTGTRGDGIVLVEAVESVLRIRTRSPVPPDEI